MEQAAGAGLTVTAEGKPPRLPPGADLAAADALVRPAEREREATALVGTGPSTEEIAHRLVVSPLTAKTRVNHTMVKR